MKKNYSKSVAMICPTCGSGEFSFNDDDAPVVCMGCNRIFAREELMHENGAVIEAAFNDMTQQVFKDAAKEFKNIFKKLK